MPSPGPAPLSTRTLLLLWGAVVIIKLSYLAAYSALPFLDGPIFDAQVYLAQAQAVAHGRFGDATLLAFSPLYGYYLALLSASAHPLWPVWGQLALGCLNLLLLFRLCRRLFDERAALVSAALYLGYGTLLFYESKILSETLGVSLSLLTLALYLSPRFAAGDLRAGLGCGASLGLAILARASLLFSAPFFVGIALLPFARGASAWAPRLRRSAALCAGLCLVLGGNGLWTYLHSGFFVPVIFVSQTVAKTTGKQWTGRIEDLNQEGDVGPWDVVRQAQERLRARQGGAAPAPAPAGPRRIAEREAPRLGINLAGLLRGAPAKLRSSLLDLEISSFMYSYYGERSELRLFLLLPVSFGMLLLLGGVGGAFLARRPAGPLALLPYLPLLLGPLVTLVLYHPSSRYRLAMVLPALVLAGHGAASIARLAPRPRRYLGALVGLLLLWMGARHLGYQLQNPAMWHAMVARSAYIAGDDEQMLARVRRAVGAGPLSRAMERYLRNLAPGHPGVSALLPPAPPAAAAPPTAAPPAPSR